MKPGKDYIGVGVGGMVFNAAGEVFLSQRGPKATNERGAWEFPGGRVEFGETLSDARCLLLHESSQASSNSAAPIRADKPR